MNPLEFAAVVRERWPLLWKEIADLGYMAIVERVDWIVGNRLTWNEWRVDLGFPALLRYLSDMDAEGDMDKWKLPDGDSDSVSNQVSP